MFLCTFFNVFYKREKKHVFMFFYSKINVFIIYAKNHSSTMVLFGRERAYAKVFYFSLRVSSSVAVTASDLRQRVAVE